MPLLSAKPSQLLRFEISYYPLRVVLYLWRQFMESQRVYTKRPQGIERLARGPLTLFVVPLQEEETKDHRISFLLVGYT
jgi:hypothetical protein